MKIEEAIVYLLATSQHGMKTEQIARELELRGLVQVLFSSADFKVVFDDVQVNLGVAPRGEEGSVGVQLAAESLRLVHNQRDLMACAKSFLFSMV